MKEVLVWLTAALTIAGILIRPRFLSMKSTPEAVWACAGAALLIVLRAITPQAALNAAARGVDVYLFLAGMMLLSELARVEGVFDWLAGLAVRAAQGSRSRLFTLVYGVGILITVFLSNDATAVVLTPAVYAVLRKARTEPLPYLLSCAFIANAASFVLPISNPANLVVYGSQLPPLVPWLTKFLLPSLASILTTFAVLRFIERRSLRGRIEDDSDRSLLSSRGRRAALGMVFAAMALSAASVFGVRLGIPTLATALCAIAFATRLRTRAVGTIVRGVSWSVLPLVAGLFVLVEALTAAGALHETHRLLGYFAKLPPTAGSLSASFAVALLSNFINNLPSGLLAASALRTGLYPDHIRYAVLIGVDLGPNLSITGSLATILWLIAIRREGEHINGWTFFKAGALVMPPALLLAVAALNLGLH